MSNTASSYFRTVRGYQLANKKEGQLTSAMEDYLEMVFRLCEERGYARVVQISDLLHVKPSSASKMISKLVDLDYLQSDRYEVIRLTQSGCKIGKYLLKRHETVETFLKLVGSLTPLEETELIEHTLNPSTVSAISVLNDFFAEDPEARQRFLTFSRQTAEQSKAGLP